ncbi:phosphatase PAP2-related protein [Mucilaginibacter sp.]|uniref:phosphatase PAP2-related protein n=1 Tax=Mucilaginibacter sp. TaxID=1882438 RepID=UPI0035BBD229
MPQNNTPTIRQVWTAALQTHYTRYKILSGSFIVAVILSALPLFFNQIQKREGVVLNDLVLAYLIPHNVSIAIFACIWGMAGLVFYRALYKPEIYIHYVWTLIFISIARIITISIVSLNPPIGLVELVDPITGVFYGNTVVTKDLFFSGHTATMVLICLCLEKKSDKIIGAIATLAVMVLLLIQHIHYTIDVLAAPFIVYIIFRLTKYFLKRDHTRQW